MNRLASVGAALVLAGSIGSVASAQDVQAGRAVALKTCAACHDVSDGDQMIPLMKPPAPSFRSIANRPGTTPESLMAFLKTKHHPSGSIQGMPGLKTSDEQLQAAVSYIMSLRGPARSN